MLAPPVRFAMRQHIEGKTRLDKIGLYTEIVQACCGDASEELAEEVERGLPDQAWNPFAGKMRANDFETFR